MKNNLARLFLFVADIGVIYLALAVAYYTRAMLNDFFPTQIVNDMALYTHNYLFYVFVLFVFYYEGIYTKRYDFWHESHKAIKGLILSHLFIFTFLAFTKNIDQYSRAVIVFSFLYLIILIPLAKNILKKFLFYTGLWHREARIYGDDPFLYQEIFNNPYLGYVNSTIKKAKTVFINSRAMDSVHLKERIDMEMRTSHEVIFIPLLNDYNMSQSDIYELSTSRTNLIEIKNRLKSKVRVFIQNLLNYLLVIITLPLILPIIAIFALLIKQESKGAVFFAHERVGRHGRIIPTYKFRSMYHDASERLKKLLEQDEALKVEWETNFKLKDDPRITKVGKFLRKTSLDELPQIFNILRGEMNFVGPRPVIQEEIEKYYGDDAEYYYMVKPGITGLWQVSGRSDTDYPFRVATDKWYVTNWSIWLDIVILFKTVKVVVFQKGAY